MGLLDNVLGSVLGGGSRTQAGGGGSSSLLIQALLALMAAKGMGGSTGGMGGLGGMLGGREDNQPAGGGLGGLLGGLTGGGMGGSGGLGGLLGGSGGLGGLLGGGGLAGGLGTLLQQFQQSGHGDVANSWVGHGQNATISPNQLTEALGPNTLDELAAHTGMAKDDIAAQLSQQLPQVIDKLSPEGRLPTEDETSRWV